MKTLLVFASKIENRFKELEGPENEVLITGIGKLNASISLSRKIFSDHFDRIINIGICGAVSEEIPLFSIFSIDKTIEGDKDVFKGKNYLNLPLWTDLKFEAGIVITQDRVIQNEPQRQHVLGLGGKLVDMECYALAKTAFAYHVPFFAVKIVSDYADASSFKNLQENILLASEKICTELTPFLKTKVF